MMVYLGKFMKTALLLVAISASLFQFLPLESTQPHPELSERMTPENFRYDSFQKALDLMEERRVKVIVETGTARSGLYNFSEDSYSTLIFSHWAQQHKAKVYSVDNDSLAIAAAKEETYPYADSVDCVCADSVLYLNRFNQPIDFLYLDSFDYDFNNPDSFQRHHLREIIVAYPHLTKKSIVMIDDCALPGGGKGLLVIQYLLDRGWKIVSSGYQCILAQDYPNPSSSTLDEYLAVQGFPAVIENHLEEVQEQQFIDRLITTPEIKTIAEIGLNAGHSTHVFFQCCEKLEKCVSFDSNQRPYVNAVADYFSGKYKSRFSFVEGNTQVMVPEFSKLFPRTKFDLVLIDGDHSYEGALQDIFNSKTLAHSHTYLWIDNSNIASVKNAIDVAEQSGLIEIDQIHPEKQGWVEAHYLPNSNATCPLLSLRTEAKQINGQDQNISRRKTKRDKLRRLRHTAP